MDRETSRVLHVLHHPPERRTNKVEETTFEGKWVVDSETGKEHLVNIRTNQVEATKDENGVWRNGNV